MHTRWISVVTWLALCLAPSSLAEVVASSDTHYVLRQEATSALSPGDLWKRLIQPAAWWHPDHTYSGDAGNLSLDASAGGLWKEVWEEGSVEHGRVLLAQTGKVLRLDAPFGPLQGAGAKVIWTITLEPAKTGGGTKITFGERALGPAGAALDKLAGAVDGVKKQAIERLADPELAQ